MQDLVLARRLFGFANRLVVIPGAAERGDGHARRKVRRLFAIRNVVVAESKAATRRKLGQPPLGGPG